MKEHLYKAKRVNWKELPKEEWWVEGNLLISGDDYYIISDFGVSCVEKLNNFVCDKLITLHAFEVEKETVCEYTGLTDKNGRKIFENDFVSCRQYIGGNWVEYCIERGYVEMKHGAFGLHRKQGYYRPFKDWLEDYEYEVIGNVFDNPELLEGGAE